MAYINNMNPDRFSIEYILQENFYDTDSFLVSNKFLHNLNEAQKINLADAMGSKAFKNSEKKLEHLNRKGYFLDLPKTRGNITKSNGYITTKKCIILLKPIMEKAKGKNTVEAMKAFQTCESCLQNLEKNVKYFEKAYSENDAANILAYQTVSLALFEFTSIVLINCTVFTENNALVYRDPPVNSLEKNILAKNINKFNDICRNNKLRLNEELDNKIEEYTMVYGESFLDAVGAVGSAFGVTGGLAAGMGILTIASSIIALIYLTRTLICYFYFKKTQISENLKYASDMIEANGLSVSNGDPKNKRIGERQTHLASSLKNIGNKLDSDNKQAQHNAVSELKKEDMETTSSVANSIESNIDPDARDEVRSINNVPNPGDDLFI